MPAAPTRDARGKASVLAGNTYRGPSLEVSRTVWLQCSNGIGGRVRGLYLRGHRTKRRRRKKKKHQEEEEEEEKEK